MIRMVEVIAHVEAGPIRDTNRSTIFSICLMRHARARFVSPVAFVVRARKRAGVVVARTIGDTSAPVEAHVGVFVGLSLGEGLGLRC